MHIRVAAADNALINISAYNGQYQVTADWPQCVCQLKSTKKLQFDVI